MKYLTILLFVLFLPFISCTDKNASKNRPKDFQVEVVKSITTKDLLVLFNNIDDEEYLTSKLDSLGFRKKFGGVYISKEFITENEPKYWVYTTNIGAFSSISISTADKNNWGKLIKELESFSNPESFEDGTSYKAKRYIGQNYTFESYEPKDGVNLSSNELYQILVFKTTKK